MFWHISYISSATSDFQDGTLGELEKQASEANTELNITGMLVFDGSHFFQYLEGDKEKVVALFAKIRQDHRHQSVTALSEGPVSKRLFGGWGMKSFLPSNFLAEDRVHILDILSQKHEKESIPNILEGLRVRSEV